MPCGHSSPICFPISVRGAASKLNHGLRSAMRKRAASFRRACEKNPLRLAQGAGDSLRPLRLPGGIAHEVLAYFDFDMRQRARLAMPRDAVIGLVADKVRFVVRDPQRAVA